MFQVFILSEIYMLVSAAILLADRYGVHMILLINIRSFYLDGRKRQILFPVAGLLLTAGLLFFPVSPGPMILGDLLPAVTVLILVFNFTVVLASGDRVTSAALKNRLLGTFALITACLHFLFPSIVLI